MLSKNIENEMERLAKEKGWSEETYEQWGKEHLRTPIRNENCFRYQHPFAIYCSLKQIPRNMRLFPH